MQRWPVWMSAFLVACAIAAVAGIGVGEDQATIRDRVLAGKRDVWLSMVREWHLVQRDTADALLEVAKDERRSAEDRADAVQALSSIATPEVIWTFAARIKERVEFSRDSVGTAPFGRGGQEQLFKWGLERCGWAAVPDVLVAVEQGKCEGAMPDVAQCLVNMCGFDVLRAAVALRRERASGSQASHYDALLSAAAEQRQGK